MKKGDIVKIEWIDIITELSTPKLSDAIEAVSIGRVECQRGKSVKLASGWYKDKANWPDVDGTTIPKGCIEKVTILEAVK